MTHRMFRSVLLVSCASVPALSAGSALAQEGATAGGGAFGNEITVTAQRRSESIQDVPISIQALTTEKLEELNVQNFMDYTKYLPSVSYQTSQPGKTTVYIRGVASGGDGQHSGSLPSVGTYLNEQPITTVGGTLDLHVYDVERIEALSGPQGTLYGASSEAGTIRIITNKPDTDGLYGRVDSSLNTLAHGTMGGSLEGFLNIPISSNTALRLVGFYRHDGGFIDNIPGSRQFLAGLDGQGNPDPNGMIVTNDEYVEEDYNEVDTYGGRAALRIDLDENWTVDIEGVGQEQRADGFSGYDGALPGYSVQHFTPEYSRDQFLQGALTVQGKISNWDVTYAAAYMWRKIDSSSDFSDYSVGYDQLFASYGGLADFAYFHDEDGNEISSIQPIIAEMEYTKMSHELRVASPDTSAFRVMGGLFYQRQVNDIYEDLPAEGLAANLSVNGHPGTVWLTQQQRIDRDYAVFGEAHYDITSALTLTGGLRYYRYDNTLIGFYGYGRDFDGPPWNAGGSSRTGVAGCFTQDGSIVRDGTGAPLLPTYGNLGPCTNLADIENGQLVPKQAKGDGVLHRLNLTWNIAPDKMVYATWSRGFRPGGINRRTNIAPYDPDYLQNYEVGFKTSWDGGRLVWNGAFFLQDWKDFQYSFLGQNGLTEIHNGPDARIKGIETDVTFRPVPGLTLSSAATYTDGKLRDNLCVYDDPTHSCGLPGPNGQNNSVVAPTGTRLPVTPKFKINGVARYAFDLGAETRAHVQGSVVYQTKASAALRLGSPTDPIPMLGSFASVDLATGIKWGNANAELFVSNLFDVRAATSIYQQCGACSFATYFMMMPPRRIGVRFGFDFGR